MGEWTEWSDWVREGYYISYRRGDVRYYEHIISRDLAHYVLEWEETIEAGEESGPYTYDDYLLVTKGYDEQNNTNRVWQLIFGIKGQCYIYIELPTDRHRHGLPKAPKPSSTLRKVSHFEEWMSDFHEPSFVTEHFMLRPGYERINWSAYNPNSIDKKPYLNIFIARCITERIGYDRNGKLYIRGYRIDEPLPNTAPAMTKELFPRWKDTLDLLWKRRIPHRPLTLQPVWAPEAE